MLVCRTRPPLIERIRFQLPLLVLVAAIIPYGLRTFTATNPLLSSLFRTTSFSVVVAIIIGFLIARNVNQYPGAESSASIFPSYSASFGAMLLFLIFFRINYNLFILLFGFFATLSCSFVLSILQQRSVPRIGILPFGDTDALASLPGVQWSRIPSLNTSIDNIDAIAVDLRSNLPAEWDARLADIALQFIPVLHSKHLAESLTGRVELEHLTENNFGSLAPASAYMVFKHSLDWVVAAIMAITLSPLMLFIALAVKVTSPGSALFRQQRIGYQGRPFTVFKFRTMRQADPVTDARDAAITKPGDARITRLGSFLRISRLDELPQILNVLRGEMSWIGPRPEADILSRWYQAEIPFYRYRHIIRPGIAGWAQVNQGHVAAVEDVKSKLHYDFYYIKNYSLWLDFLIVFLTIRTMITGHGAR